jgi:Uma2 family endonuclease
MPPAAVKSAATYEDLLKVPSHLVAEILDGDLYATPRPGLPHARAASVLGGKLGDAFDHGTGGPGGWWILFEPELHLRSDIIVPDLAGWRRERLPQIPAAAYMTLAPDWVCEVVSPSTEALDRAKKIAIYARESVSHLWLINPVARTLEVMELDAGRWVLLAAYADQEMVHAKPFDAITLQVGSLWSGTAER